MAGEVGALHWLAACYTVVTYKISESSIVAVL